MKTIVVPVYNEAENIVTLYWELWNEIEKGDEIIYINDGSTDGSKVLLDGLAGFDERVRVINFVNNQGQTAALDIGFKEAKGDIIIPIDGDLQNDPHDIPRLVKKLEEGYDLVCGWRYKRKDPFSKRFLSKGAMYLRRILLNDVVHDSGCTLKAIRKEAVRDLELKREYHRFIPALLSKKGYKVTEIKVNHRARVMGETKYDLSRVFRGFKDILLIRFKDSSFIKYVLIGAFIYVSSVFLLWFFVDVLSYSAVYSGSIIFFGLSLLKYLIYKLTGFTK